MTQAPAQPAEIESPRDGAGAPRHTPAPPDDDRRLSRRRFGVLVGSHFTVDLYPIFIVALAVSLQENLGLTNAERALVIAIGPIVSGICQPLFAWIGDVLNTRLFGPLGLAVGALAIGSIGFAESLTQLLILQTVGLIGVGVYHPISSAVAGRLGRDALTGVRFVHSPRTTGLAIFFLAGMLGGTAGPVIASGINSGTGDMRWMAVMIVPGLVMAWVLWSAIRAVEHKSAPAGAAAAAPLDRLGLRRWGVAALFASNTLRFVANVGCYFLFTAWAREHYAAADAGFQSQRASLLVAATTLGMSVATIIAAFQRPGGERRLLAITGIASAPFICVIPLLPLPGMLAAAFIASTLYFIGIPSGISLSHRLLPHATGITGSLLMGMGWVISASGPIAGETILGLGEHGMLLAFCFMGLMLLLSGLAGLFLNAELVRDTLAEDAAA